MWPFSRKPARPEPTPLERYNRLRELGWNEYEASLQSGFTPGQGPNGGPFGACPMCLAARGDMPTGRNARQWEREADERAAYLAEGENARQPIYQRAAEPIRYNAQVEEWQGQEMQEWHAPTKAEFNAWANEAWQAIQAAPHSNTPDANYQPTAAEAAYLGQQSPRLEARNNDGSTELPAHFSGSMGNYATANLRHEREQAGGQYVTIRGQQIWVED